MGEKTKINIICDTREKEPWSFEKEEWYEFNTTVGTLKTGDYSLVGLEELFVIERKGRTSELAQNILELRFEKEFERLTNFKYPFVVCEFDMRDVLNYPVGSGIPQRLWSSIRISGAFLLKRITELQVKYNVPFWFVGEYGTEVATSLFKRMNKLCQ